MQFVSGTTECADNQSALHKWSSTTSMAYTRIGSVLPQVIGFPSSCRLLFEIPNCEEDSQLHIQRNHQRVGLHLFWVWQAVLIPLWQWTLLYQWRVQDIHRWVKGRTSDKLTTLSTIKWTSGIHGQSSKTLDWQGYLTRTHMEPFTVELSMYSNLKQHT